MKATISGLLLEPIEAAGPSLCRIDRGQCARTPALLKADHSSVATFLLPLLAPLRWGLSFTHPRPSAAPCPCRNTWLRPNTGAAGRRSFDDEAVRLRLEFFSAKFDRGQCAASLILQFRCYLSPRDRFAIPQITSPASAGLFFGSSPIAAESGSDIEEEVPVVQKSLCHSLDDIDLVVEAFEQACV